MRYVPEFLWPNLKETNTVRKARCEMKDNIKTDIKKRKGGIKLIYVGGERNN
jgi:hypothetical protein